MFFEEAVSLTRADGFAVLERGDSVVMDNCGFHHGHFVEPILTETLDDCRVQLIFQPPYSPQFKGELRGKNEVILDDWPLYHVSIFDNIIC